jgi:hypothetical protein
MPLIVLKLLPIVVAILLWAVWFMFSLNMAGLSIMALDAPGSETMILPWVFIASAAVCPVWSIACLLIGANQLRHGNVAAALWRLAASLLGVVPVALVMFVGIAITH